MKSEYCQWLNDLADIAEPKGIIINARYHDGLDFFFLSKLTPKDTLPKYQNLVTRCEAIDGRQETNHPVLFADWLNNNWLIPSSDGFWKLDKDNIEYSNTIGTSDDIFTTEELFKLFTEGKGEY